MSCSAVLVAPAPSLSVRRLQLAARAGGFADVHVVAVNGDNPAAVAEADLPFCQSLDAIVAAEPRVVGFSSFYWNVLYHLKLASAVKRLRPNTLVLFGGPQATGDHEQLLRQHPAVDAVALGEGEMTFVDVLTCMRDGGDACQTPPSPGWQAGVSGLAYRDSTGRIVRSAARDVVLLETLPSPVLAADRLVTQGKLIWELARGCPYRCTYCFEARMHHAQRLLPLDRVERELEVICADDRIAEVWVLIPTLNQDETYAMALLDSIEKYNRRSILFQFELKPDLDRSRLHARMAGMTGIRVSFGLQTTSGVTSKLIRRPLNVAKAEGTIRGFCSTWDARASVDLMCFLPGEGVDNFFASFDRTLAWRPHSVAVRPLRVLPGTELWKAGAASGLLFDDTPPYAVVASSVLAPDEAILLRKVAPVAGFVGRNMPLLTLLANLAEAHGVQPSTIVRRAVAELDGDPSNRQVWQNHPSWDDDKVDRKTVLATTGAMVRAIVACMKDATDLDADAGDRLLEIVRFCCDVRSVTRVEAVLEPGASTGAGLTGRWMLIGSFERYAVDLLPWLADRRCNPGTMLGKPGETTCFLGPSRCIALPSAVAAWLASFEQAREATGTPDDVGDAVRGLDLVAWLQWARAEEVLLPCAPDGDDEPWDVTFRLNPELALGFAGPGSFTVEATAGGGAGAQTYLDIDSNALEVVSRFAEGTTPREVLTMVSDQMTVSEAEFMASVHRLVASRILLPTT